MKLVKIYLLITCLALSTTTDSQDMYHYYRASPFFGEPRLEKSWLSTIEFTIFSGSTSTGKNAKTSTVPVFDIYGIHNMRLLGSGVPNKDITNTADLALINLANTPANGCYAEFSFPGSFKVLEGALNVTQNFAHGMFAQMYIPFRQFTISPQHFIDLSPAITDGPTNINTPEWQEFIAQFNAILSNYNLNVCKAKVTGLGAVSAELGWTLNYQETELLDFVDATFKAGVLLRTGTDKNEDSVFDISTGYDKHFGFPLSFDMSFGLYDWFTSGIHAGVIGFLDRNKEIRMKTDINQSGMIKLAKGNARVSLGPIWDIGLYSKADHMADLISIIVGYTFAQQQNTTLCPQNCTGDNPIFDVQIVNSDQMYKGWQMNTLHFLVELDFTKENRRFGPRVGFIFNGNAGGKRVFKNNTIGGYAGIDVAWCY